MDKLFKEFIQERRYLHNLSEATLTFYTETYRQFELLGTFENLSKEALRVNETIHISCFGAKGSETLSSAPGTNNKDSFLGPGLRITG